MKKIIYILLCINAKLFAQNIPTIGDTNYIEIGNWNIEWFGNTAYGPTNESLQQSNVQKVLDKSNIDIWGLEEVSDSTAWKNLYTALPNYFNVISSWTQTQKTALLCNKNTCKIIYKKNPLAQYDREFAGGRMPLEVGIEINFKNKKDTLIVFVLHLKANTGTTAEKATAWDLRKRSSEFLKEYIDAGFINKNVIIIGDWNDDLDASILSGYATPFSKIKADTNYIFPSFALTISGKSSTVSYNNIIDHQCYTNAMKNKYIASSCSVFNLSSIITSYGTTTSDHYPVYSKYDFTKRFVPVAGTKDVLLKQGIVIFYANNTIQIPYSVEEFNLYTADGKEIKTRENVNSGIYLYRAKIGKRYYSGKILIR